MRPPGPPGRCQAVLVSPTAAPVYSTARPARTAPPLCCGTAAACGLGLRPPALGASGGDPPAPGLFLTAQRRRFAPRPDRTRPLAGGAVRDDTADRVSERGLPENSQRGGLDPNNWQAGFRPAGSGLGGDKGSTCQEWIVQYKPITGPKFTWSVTPAAANSKGLVVGNAERFPAAGRRRGNPVEGPSGTGCLWTRRAAQPFREAESIGQSMGFPCLSNRTGTRQPGRIAGRAVHGDFGILGMLPRIHTTRLCETAQP